MAIAGEGGENRAIWLAIYRVEYAILAHLPVRNRFKGSSGIAGIAIAKGRERGKDKAILSQGRWGDSRQNLPR